MHQCRHVSASIQIICICVQVLGGVYMVCSKDFACYRRSSFDCEILLIANCEFFHNSQSKESQEKDYSINNILPAWQFAIIKSAIPLV